MGYDQYTVPNIVAFELSSVTFLRPLPLEARAIHSIVNSKPQECLSCTLIFPTNCLEIAASLEFGNLYVLGQVHISKDFIKRKTDLDTYHLTTSRHQFFPIDITDYQSPKQRLPIPHAPKGSDRMALNQPKWP